MNQTEWKTEVVLPSVSFAPLILPSQESVKDLEALEIGERYITPHKTFIPSLSTFCILLMCAVLIPIPPNSCGASLTEAVLSTGSAQVLGEREIPQDM